MKTKTLLTAFAASAMFAGSASAATLVSIDHDGTSGDEASPFDTKVLSNSTDWTYTTDGSRSIMTATDSATSGNNRLILVETDGITQFSSGTGPATHGWVYEIELEILAGDGTSSIGFANFGVRSENGDGKTAWVGLTDDGGTGGAGQIGFVNSAGNGFIGGTATSLDVDSLIADGQYHNFKLYKYDNAGTTVVEGYLDGVLVISADYADLDNDDASRPDIQAFASSTPVPSSSVNIDYVNFTLYDNLTESAVPEPGSLALIGLGGLCVLRRRRG